MQLGWLVLQISTVLLTLRMASGRVSGGSGVLHQAEDDTGRRRRSRRGPAKSIYLRRRACQLWEYPGGHCKTKPGSRNIKDILHTVALALNQLSPQRRGIKPGLDLRSSHCLAFWPCSAEELDTWAHDSQLINHLQVVNLVTQAGLHR